ncbi:MAG: restriction endonuclease subunit S, partial [Paucihalobacter sp.]
VDPLHQKIIVNSKQNQTLASLRDWLLPMLMNGQVRVGNSLEKGNLGDVESGLGMVAEEGEDYNKNK